MWASLFTNFNMTYAKLREKRSNNTPPRTPWCGNALFCCDCTRTQSGRSTELFFLIDFGKRAHGMSARKTSLEYTPSLHEHRCKKQETRLHEKSEIARFCRRFGKKIIIMMVNRLTNRLFPEIQLDSRRTINLAVRLDSPRFGKQFDCRNSPWFG